MNWGLMVVCNSIILLVFKDMGNGLDLLKREEREGKRAQNGALGLSNTCGREKGASKGDLQ